MTKVRECAIGRSYDDCEGDAREERACNPDQVAVAIDDDDGDDNDDDYMVMMMIIW